MQPTNSTVYSNGTPGLASVAGLFSLNTHGGPVRWLFVVWLVGGLLSHSSCRTLDKTTTPRLYHNARGAESPKHIVRRRFGAREFVAGVSHFS